jgi:hypothetical protein
MTSGRQEGAKAIIRFEEPTVVAMNIDLLFSGNVVIKSFRYYTHTHTYVCVYIYIYIYMQYFFSEEVGVSTFRLRAWKSQAAVSSESLVFLYQTTRRHIPESHNFRFVPVHKYMETMWRLDFNLVAKRYWNAKHVRTRISPFWDVTQCGLQVIDVLGHRVCPPCLN